MSFTMRSRRVAYDNIAIGSAAGKERTIAGNGGSSEVYANGELLKPPSGASSAAVIESYISGSAGVQTNENVG